MGRRRGRDIHTIFALEEVEQPRGEVVAELGESLLQLAPVNGARAIAVEVAEDVLPVLLWLKGICQIVLVNIPLALYLDVLPETSKLKQDE